MIRTIIFKLQLSLVSLVILLALSLPALAAENEKQIEHETGFYYTVQKGDTLWDLSRKFSDTPWQWPEMWNENNQIANPHRIYPGERIRLYRRKGMQGYGDKAPSDKDAGVLGKVEFDYSSMDRVGFIRKEPITHHGTIFKVREAKEMISVGDIVYIHAEPGFSFNPGEQYTTYRTLVPIKHRKTHRYIGIQHYLTGIVEIRLMAKNFVLAEVIKAYHPINIGDLLMPYNRRLQRIKLQESVKGLYGTIIESEEHRDMFAETNLVFIDKGEDDGVKPGQFYHVYYQEKYRNPKSGETLLAPNLLGELLVLHTEKTTATALITDSEQKMHAGEAFRTPFRVENDIILEE